MNYFWIALAVIMLVLELLTPGNLIFVWFAVGALGGLAARALGAGLPLQIIVFAAVSLVSLLLARRFLWKKLQTRPVATNADRLIGCTFSLSQTLTQDSNVRETMEGDSWLLAPLDNQTIPAGTLVRVDHLSGVRLVVTPVAPVKQATGPAAAPRS
ncbi:MAG: NfeD family protein [Oscillospiraceae bacterium]|nr:NfeD family protein [Oscillospiraceae bacterium]